MRLLLFAGFLGSGKTSLILTLARRLSETGRSSCIIVNEVGEIGIDGRVLAEGGLEVFEITAGCICCQVGVDLVRTLERVDAGYRPDLVIIEASGVATPAGVLDALRYFSAPWSARCVSLLDPTRLEMLLEVVEPLLDGQITAADEIVVTKADLCNDGELAFACAAAARYAPGTPVVELSLLDAAATAAYVEGLIEGCALPAAGPDRPAAAAPAATARVDAP